MAVEQIVGITAVIPRSASPENFDTQATQDFYNKYKKLGGIFREPVASEAITFLLGRNGHHLPNIAQELQAEMAARRADINLTPEQKKLYSILRNVNTYGVPKDELTSVDDIPMKHSDQVIVAQVLLFSGLISGDLEPYQTFRNNYPHIFKNSQ